MANSKSSAYGRSVDYRRFSICHSLWAKRAADFLLEQAIGMNAELAKQIKELTKEAFLNYLIQHRGIICVTDTFPKWEMSQMVKTIHAIVTNDIDSFQAVFQKIPSLLKRQYIKQQIELLEAAYSNGYAFAKLRLEEHTSHNSILIQSPRL